MSSPVNPIERPPYRRTRHPRGVLVEVEGSDWKSILSTAGLALSDVIRPVGRFGTWTARRITARGDAPATTLSAWLGRVLADHLESGFSTALVEVEKAETGRASGILRGGLIDASETPPSFDAVAVPAGEVVVTEGKGDGAWTAHFVVEGRDVATS